MPFVFGQVKCGENRPPVCHIFLQKMKQAYDSRASVKSPFLEVHLQLEFGRAPDIVSEAELTRGIPPRGEKSPLGDDDPGLPLIEHLD